MPDLQVLKPKGTGGGKTVPGQEKEQYKQRKQGDKRIWAQNPEEVRPEKRKREKSPTPGDSRLMGKPTFLTDEKQMARTSPGDTSMDIAQEPDPELTQTTESQTKNTVKERIKKLNMRTQNSPGKFPEMKQTMIRA